MGNPVTLSELGKALDNLLLDEAPPMLAEDDITITRLADRAKIGQNKATRLLTRWTQEGKVEYVGLRRVQSGNKVKAWRLVVK